MATTLTLISSAPVQCVASKRSRFLNLLQIGGVLLIVAGHSRLRGAQCAAMTVELFFVVAGMNMARYVDRHKTLCAFAYSRATRMLPEISAVWLLTLLAFLLGLRGAGAEAFLISIPFFLQNFAEPYLQPVVHLDWAFLAALWFVAALLQLQILVFLLRKVFARYHPAFLVISTACLGAIFTALAALFHGGITRDLAYSSSDAIYRMAITHAPPFVFGFMLGRGLLPRIGKWFPLLAASAALMGALNYLFARPQIAISSLGYPVGMPANFQYVWGYPLVALALTSFCAPDSIVARVVFHIKCSPGIDRALDKLARLTFGVYVFHGVMLAAVEYVVWSRTAADTGRIRFLTFALVAIFSFASAWLFQRGWRWARCRVCAEYPNLVGANAGHLPARCLACGYLA